MINIEMFEEEWANMTDFIINTNIYLRIPESAIANIAFFYSLENYCIWL